ncbi:MAG: peroxide stress protein YaaA, partial [Bacteroidales bacterium]|nr:peroxide stress protein YaaA [Bacteroidales bacterium]
VWAKACRGAMVRHIVTNRVDTPEALQAFSYEGFSFRPDIGEERFPHFVRDDR